MVTSESAGLERIAPASFERQPLFARALPIVKRYCLSTGGPLAVSGAHFVASMILLHALAPAEFGLFSFLLIVVPFSLSLGGALVSAPFVTGLSRTGTIEAPSLATHLKANLVLSLAASVAVSIAMASGGARMGTALLLGLYGGTMVLRAFGRSYAYVSGEPARALLCDLVYGTVVTVGLVLLYALDALTMDRTAAVLAAAALLGFVAFRRDYLVRQFRPGLEGSLLAYAVSWRELARWAALGVALTEFTANAHAYIVTFVAGPKAFALLAVGSLVMRPASLVLTALPDIERPRMARKIGIGDVKSAFRSVKEFRTAVAAIWLLTLMLASAILIWAPHLLLKKGYDEAEVATVIAVWGAIFAVRTLRTPESVILQAAGEFRALAGASLWASVVAVAATFALLLAAGPIAALGGILAGDLVMTANIFSLTRKWKRRHV